MEKKQARLDPASELDRFIYFSVPMLLHNPYANHGAGIFTNICPRNHPNVGIALEITQM